MVNGGVDGLSGDPGQGHPDLLPPADRTILTVSDLNRKVAAFVTPSLES
jgi:hypothetical protein